MASDIELVLKDRTGGVCRSLSLPKKNAEKLIGFGSGWGLPDNSPYEISGGEVVEKKIKPAKDKSPEK